MLHLEIQDTSPATSATGPAISILKAFAWPGGDKQWECYATLYLLVSI